MATQQQIQALKSPLWRAVVSQPWPWRGYCSPPPLAVLAYALGVVLYPIPLGTGSLIVGLLGAALAVTIAVASKHVHILGLAYAAAATAAVGAWLIYANINPTFAVFDMAITGDALTVLGIGTAVLLPLWVAVKRWARRHPDGLPIPSPVAQVAQALGIDSDKRLIERAAALAGLRGVSYVDTITAPGGRRITATTSPAGSTVDDVLRSARRLEHAMGAAYKGALRVEGATDRPGVRDFYLHVSETDALAEDVTFPDDTSPLSIVNPLWIGRYADSTALEVLLPENSGKIFGVRGSGKSGGLHAIIRQLTRCTDNVTLLIDPKRGPLAGPWVAPWVLGRTDHPVIPMVAGTLAEAERMMEMLLAIGADRVSRLVSADKVTISPKLPHIQVIIDELPQLVKSAKFTTRLQELVALYRAAGIDVIAAAQRGTGPQTGGRDLISQLPLSLVYKVADPAEAWQVLQGNGANRIKIEDFEHPGSLKAFNTGATDRDIPARTAFTPVDDIPAIAEAHAANTTDLDPDALAVARRFGWDDRWTTGTGLHIMNAIRTENGVAPDGADLDMLRDAVSVMPDTDKLTTELLATRLAAHNPRRWADITAQDIRTAMDTAGVPRKGLKESPLWPEMSSPRGYRLDDITAAIVRHNRP
ncbi:hypothetical protein AB0I28_09700 [Phytomonospora sp. NPDC050363]|uniref:hypothetical protein n=1 Tax=Phytomonospora sp. NPDC050363 TaxID=3155642 RepID=UPI0033FC9AD6